MSRRFFCAALAAAVVLGALRLTDLLLFTDAEGFCTVGSAWLRYAAAAVYWAAVYILSPKERAAAPVFVPARAAFALLGVLSVAAAVVSAQQGIADFFDPQTALARDPSMRTMELLWLALRLAAGAGWLCMAVWCAALCALRTPLSGASGAARAAGYFAWTPFLMHALLSYGVSHPSPHRILYIVPVFAYVSAMLFATKLLGIVCLPDDVSVRRGAASSGALCFFLCTCIYLPQSVVTAAAGSSEWTAVIAQALPLGALGCVGAALALSVSGRSARTEEVV